MGNLWYKITVADLLLVLNQISMKSKRCPERTNSQVHSFPIRIVPGVEGPSVYIKLITKNEVELFTIDWTILCRFPVVYLDQ